MSRGRWILFVAARYLQSRKHSGRGMPGLLAVFGLGVGVMTLTTVLTVMNGFQLSAIDDLLEVSSFHLQITGMPDAAAAPALAARIREVPGVSAAEPFREDQVIVSGRFGRPQVALARAVSPGIMERDQGLAEQLQSRAGNREPAGSGVVLGELLARDLGALIDDEISIRGFADALFGGPGETGYQVAGIVRTGSVDIDSALILVDIGNSPIGRERSALGIKLDQPFRDSRMVDLLTADDGLLPEGAGIRSWRDFNRAIFAALRLEKNLMILLVGLILGVVGVTIFHGLRRTVLDRRQDLAVLLAIGAPPTAVRSVFVLEGLIIGVAGSVPGALLGLLLAQNVDRVFAAFAALGQVFGVRTVTSTLFAQVPARAIPGEIIGIALAGIAAAAIAAIAATRYARDVNPAEIIRND